MIGLASFFDELTKIAGVGVDIHGYHRTPENSALQKKESAQWEQFERQVGNAPMGKKPGWFRRVFVSSQRIPPKPEEEKAWRAKSKQFWAKNPPVDAHEYALKSRIKTPFDRDSSQGYKLHSINLMNSGEALDMATDKVYGDKPTVKNLSRSQLKMLASKYESGRDSGYKHHKVEKAFVKKINHLMKDKDMKFARLEWE